MDLDCLQVSFELIFAPQKGLLSEVLMGRYFGLIERRLTHLYEVGRDAGFLLLPIAGRR